MASFGVHMAMFALAFWVARNADVNQVTRAFDKLSDQIVWLDVPGPGGGGGGGGNQSPEPVKQVELKGKEKMTVPIEKPPAMEQPKDKPPDDPIQNLTIPAQTLAAADLAQAGAIEGIPTSDSLGLGTGGGAGTGQGTGIGSGQGSGLGPGCGGGTGGGAYNPVTASKRRTYRKVSPNTPRRPCARKFRVKYCSSASSGRWFGRQHPGRAVARWPSASIRKRLKRPSVALPARHAQGQTGPVLVTIAIALRCEGRVGDKRKAREDRSPGFFTFYFLLSTYSEVSTFRPFRRAVSTAYAASFFSSGSSHTSVRW